MNSRQLRLVRAAAASTIATTLAAVSHTVAGGPAPHPLLVVAMACLLVPLAAVLIGPRVSRLRSASTVLVGQGLFHLTFQLLGAPTQSAAASAPAHAHHVDLAAFGPAVIASAPSTVMLIAHVIAAIATVVLLWHGESLVRLIANWVRAAALRIAAHALPVRTRPRATPSLVVLLVDAALRAAPSRRGPPHLA